MNRTPLATGTWAALAAGVARCCSLTVVFCRYRVDGEWGPDERSSEITVMTGSGTKSRLDPDGTRRWMRATAGLSEAALRWI